MYTCYMPCIPQIASSNFQMQQRTTRTIAPGGIMTKATPCGRSPFRPASERTHHWNHSSFQFSTRSWLLCGNFFWQTDWTQWRKLVRELRKLRELFNMVRCQVLPTIAMFSAWSHCQLRVMAKRCHRGPGFVDHEPPQAPPSKVVAWSWANLDLEFGISGIHCKWSATFSYYSIIMDYNISWLINISYIQLLCNNHQSQRIRKIVVNDESSTIINYLCKECQVNHEVNGIKETLMSSKNPTVTLSSHEDFAKAWMLYVAGCNPMQRLWVSYSFSRASSLQFATGN